MSYDYDPELPAGFQNADLEMAALEAAGNRSAALRRRGICDHGWLRGGANGGAICNHCEQSFASFEDAYDARERVLNG